MKNLIIVVLLVASAVFGGLYFQQNRKTQQAEATTASLRENLTETEAKLDQQEKRAASLQSRLDDTLAATAAKAGEVVHLQQALTNRVEAAAALAKPVTADTTATGTNGKPANAFAEMFKSPEMKNMIKTQQKAVLGSMLDKNYASLYSTLQLSPEQSANLKDLIMKKTMVDADVGMSMISGDMDSAKRAEAMQQAKTDKEAINDQIKQFLGDANYTQFQSYEKTIPDRMSIGMFKDQQATGSGALSPDQEQQLVQAMSEERQGFKFTTDYSDQSKLSGDFASYFSEDKLKTFQQEQEKLNQRYLDRAQTFLSPDQLTSYTKFLSNQRDMQTAAMKMASKMFAPAPASAASGQ